MSLAVENFAMNFAVNEKLKKDIEKNKAEINILTNNVNDRSGVLHKSHIQLAVFLIMVVFNGGKYLSFNGYNNVMWMFMRPIKLNLTSPTFHIG